MSSKKLRHVTDKTKSDMNNVLLPFYNKDMYGERSGDYVFATSWPTASKALYFLKGKGLYLFSKDENNSIAIIKSYENFIESCSHKRYMYFISDKKFKPVTLNGGFAGEYISEEPINITRAKCIEYGLKEILQDDELGKAVNLFVCNNRETYKSIREVIDLYDDYDDKLKYLLSLEYKHDEEYEVRIIGG